MSVSTTDNLSFLSFGFVSNSTPNHLVEKGCFFFGCIAWELLFHASVGEVTDDAMCVAVYDGVYILIMPLVADFLLGDSFGLRWCGIFTLLLMLKFGAVGFFCQIVYFGSEVLVFRGAVFCLFLYSVHVRYLLLLSCELISQL